MLWSYSSQPPLGPPVCWRNLCVSEREREAHQYFFLLVILYMYIHVYTNRNMSLLHTSVGISHYANTVESETENHQGYVLYKSYPTKNELVTSV